MIGLSTILRFLLFREDAIQAVAGSRKAMWVGMLLVISAGFAREYDGEYLWAEPWHLLLPLAASLIGCTAMVILVFVAAFFRDARQAGLGEVFLSFLNLYWMTAPLAWVYAIPVERLFSPGDATRANLMLLAIVAVWRVALMVRCVQVLYGTSLKAAFAPIILFSDLLALLALWLVPGPIFMIMGGVRLSESEDVILGVRLLLGFFGFVSLAVWVIGYISVCSSRSKWHWYRSDSQEHTGGAVSNGTWMLVVAALIIWVPLLPAPQREQRLRWQAERMLRSDDIDGFCQLMKAHPADAFPPHWDPPPRIAYGESRPHVHRVVAGLIAHQGPPWVYARYLDKLSGGAGKRRLWWEHLAEYSDEELSEYVDTIEQLDNPTEIAETYQGILSTILQTQELSDARRMTLERLQKLGIRDETAVETQSQEAPEAVEGT